MISDAGDLDSVLAGVVEEDPVVAAAEPEAGLPYGRGSLGRRMRRGPGVVKSTKSHGQGTSRYHCMARMATAWLDLDAGKLLEDFWARWTRS